jgi:hypothetical protein
MLLPRCLILFLLLVPALARAEIDGIDSTLYFPPIGCGGPDQQTPGGDACHPELATDMVTVTIDGPDTIDPDAGGVGAFTATAVTAIPDRMGAGINVLIDAATTTSDCELDPFETNLMIEGLVITHRDGENPPPDGNLGDFSYTFLLINCTVPGSVRFFVAMNTFNGDLDSICLPEATCDAWNINEKTVTVPEPGAAAGSVVAAALAALARLRRRTR